MIITKTEKKFKYLTQQQYNLNILKLDIRAIRCSCGRCATLIYHGCYSRIYKHGSYRNQIMITRVLCTYCTRTHSILLEDMIPYSGYDFESIISCTKSSSDLIDCQSLKRYYRDFIMKLSSLSYEFIVGQKIRNSPLVLFPT